MKSVIIIGCSKGHTGIPGRAMDVYNSKIFNRSQKYAETYADLWFILSTKYGLLLPSDFIEPYNVSIDNMLKNDNYMNNIVPDIHRKLKMNINKGDYLLPILPLGLYNIISGALRGLCDNINLEYVYMNRGKRNKWLKDEYDKIK